MLNSHTEKNIKKPANIINTSRDCTRNTNLEIYLRIPTNHNIRSLRGILRCNGFSYLEESTIFIPFLFSICYYQLVFHLDKLQMFASLFVQKYTIHNYQPTNCSVCEV